MPTFSPDEIILDSELQPSPTAEQEDEQAEKIDALLSFGQPGEAETQERQIGKAPEQAQPIKGLDPTSFSPDEIILDDKLSPNDDPEEFRTKEMPGILGMLGYNFNPFEEFAKGGALGVISTQQAYDMAESPEEVSKVDAFLFSATHMMTDINRGIRQLFGGDDQELKKRQAMFSKVMDDSRYSGWATAGTVAGALAEPVGLLVPGLKSRSLLNAAAKGSAIGGAFGVAGYVDEEAGQTRLQNGLIGMTLGGVVGGVAKGVTEAAPAIGGYISKTKPYQEIAKRRAHKFLDNYEMDWAKLIAEGRSPQEAKQYLLTLDPKLGNKIGDAFRETNRVPHTLLTQTEAEQIVKQSTSLKKPIDVVIGTVTDPVKSLFHGIDTVGGVLSTRVKANSEAVFGRLRQYEMNIRYRPHEYLTRVDDFSSKFKNLSGGTQKRVHSYLVNGEWNKVGRVFKSEFGEEGDLAIQEVRDVLKEIGLESRKHKRLSSLLSNYFPRYIHDEKGLLQGMGKEEFTPIADALEAATQRKKAPLSPLERAEILNKRLLRPVKSTEGGPRHTKQRKFDQVPAEFLQFYAEPLEALHTYINNAVIDIEKAKFFGKGYSKVKGENFVDLSKSVGGFLEREMGDEKLSKASLNELSHLLTTRFGVGETPPHRAIQDVKNYLYAGLLGNPISATTQIGDLGSSVYANGLVDTMDAVQETITGQTKFKVKDFGLADKLTEEFASTRKSAKFLNKALRYGGFEAIDRMGKSTIVNAAYKKHARIFNPKSKLSESARDKAQAEFATKYQKVFGDEYTSLVEDLAAGRTTENVKLLLFNELADLQPIALSEMPEAYLKSPNGRIAYMFKTFIIKQLDVIRRNAVSKMTDGTVKGFRDGAWELLRYSAVIGTANTGSQYAKDFMMGRDIEATPMDVPLNLLKTLGWSEYTQNKIAEGKPVQATIDLVTPPVKIFDDVMSNPEDAVKYIPIAGRFYHNWFMGGLEEWQEKQGKSSFFGEQD